MGWFNWSRKVTDEIRAGVGALGVDLNATRLRAMSSETGRPPLTMIVDADDHALSGALVQCEANQARLLGTTAQPRLNQRVWKDRILNALADRCVRTCRRDPRDSAAAEQTLYEQIDDALDRM